MTTVINRHHKGSQYDVYIGRDKRHPETRGKWGNPYTLVNDGKTPPEFIVSTRGEAITKYREYLTTGEGRHLINDLHELKGKRLGCTCKPLPCHGDVLVELVNKYCE